MKNYRRFLKEVEELIEVTDAEMENIEDILLDMNPRDLSFNEIFGDKTRIIAPFYSHDANLNRLKALLAKSGYTPDFSTGLATYYETTFPPKYKDGRPRKMILTLPQTKDPKLTKDARTRKKQVKIGKLLQKGSRLFDAAKKAQEEFEKVKPEDFGVSPDEAKPEDEANIEKYQGASQKAEEKANIDFRKLTNVFFGTQPVMIDDTNNFAKLAEWWNKKSAFYRENPEAASGEVGEEKSSVYSVIYTRHPIDVMRMSDFDDIQSCHSPPSRSGGMGGSFYKCAVAEAHGHGIMAYVVKNEDLKGLKELNDVEDLTDQEFLDALGDEEEELFLDSERGTGDVEPVSRLRIRQFGSPEHKMEFGVPELAKQIYGGHGKSVQGSKEFYSTVKKWALENQKEQFDKLLKTAKEEDVLDLRKLERYGGSYMDYGVSSEDLLRSLLATDENEGWLRFAGEAKVDSTTEDNLTLNANVMEEWQEEVSDMADTFNRRSNGINVSAEVEDNGDGEAFISLSAELILRIPEEKFTVPVFSTPVPNTIVHLWDHLVNDLGLIDWLDDNVSYTVNNQTVIITIPIDFDPTGVEPYSYAPHELEENLHELDSLDDQYDAIYEYAEDYFRRQGIFEGSSLITLAQQLEGEDWYEWEHEIDDDYRPSDIAIETKQYVNFEDLKEKIPITFNRPAEISAGVGIMFDGNEQIGTAYQRHDGEGNFKDWEIHFSEKYGFADARMGGFGNLDAVKEFAQWSLTNVILRPEGTRIPKGWRTSRDYFLEVRRLMAGGEPSEGYFWPNPQVWVNGPDSDDEYLMMFRMELDDGDDDQTINNAFEILEDNDDEDKLKEIFRTAFAKVAKIKGASVAETKQYFAKFKDVIFS